MTRRLRGASAGPLTGARSLVPLLVVSLFLFAAPIAMLVVGALRDAAPGDPANWSLDAFTSAYSRGDTYQALRNSVVLSLVVTVVATAAAGCLAFLVTRTRTPLRRLVTPIMVLVVALPVLYYAIGWSVFANPEIGPLNTTWRDLTGASGPLFDVHSWTGIALIGVLKSTAFGYLLLIGPFSALDRGLEEASRVAGAPRWRTVLGIDIPLLAPAVLGVAILTFVIGLEYFDGPLILGRPAGLTVFSTEIYDLIDNRTPADYGGASALSLLLIVVVIALVAMQWRLLGTRSFTTVTGKGHHAHRWDIGGWRWLGTAAIVVFGLLAVVVPVGQLVVAGLQPFLGGGVYSLANYQELLQDPSTSRVLRNTIAVAVGAGLLAMVLALLIGYASTHAASRLRRVLELLTWLPWAAPGIVLSLGILWLYVGTPGLRQLYGTRWLVLLGLVVSAVPLATRAVEPALRQIGRELEEAARVGGARPVRMFLGIVLPLISRSFVSGWFLVAIVVSGNLTIPLLLSSTDSETVPLTVFRMYTNGEITQAAALFVLVLGLLAAGMAVLYLLVWLLSRRRLAARGPTVAAAPQSDLVPSA